MSPVRPQHPGAVQAPPALHVFGERRPVEDSLRFEDWCSAWSWCPSPVPPEEHTKTIKTEILEIQGLTENLSSDVLTGLRPALAFILLNIYA